MLFNIIITLPLTIQATAFYSAGPGARPEFYRRNAIAKNHIEQRVQPNADIIAEVLDINKPITQDHMNLCKDIIDDSIKLPLPVPNTEHVLPFSNAVGPENTSDPNKIKSGCYKLYIPDTDICYVGHSVHLGFRIKDHAKGHDKTTGIWAKEQTTNIWVQVYIVPKTNLFGLQLKEFLCVLEQYLFYLERPTINKVLVATAGVLQSEETILKLRQDNGTETYAYHNTPEGLKLIHVFPSRGMIGPIFGYDRLWIKSLNRYGGQFRNTLLFSSTMLPDATINLLDIADIIAIHDDAILTKSRQLWKGVKVTDMKTTPVTVTLYPSVAAASKALSADKSVFKANRKTLYKKQYKIELI